MGALPAVPWTPSTRSAPPSARSPGSARQSPAGSGSWASATRSTEPTTLARRSCAERARELGGSLIELAEQVESTILSLLVELKPAQELHTNVEFYAGVVMELCGLPRSLFTPTFAVSRAVGWCAHILEQATDSRIIRPSSRYVGPPAPAPLPLAEEGGFRHPM